MPKFMELATPWTPWLILVGICALDAANIIPGVPVAWHPYLAGLATVASMALLSRPGMAQRGGGDAIDARYLELGYRLRQQHEAESEGLLRAVGETTTGTIPGLRLITDRATVYRSTGNPDDAPQPVTAPRRRNPSPGGPRHLRST